MSANGDGAQLEIGEKAAASHIDSSTSRDGDTEAPAARGVQFDNIPANYWRSYRFLGSAFSVVLLASSLFTNFNLPVRCPGISPCSEHCLIFPTFPGQRPYCDQYRPRLLARLHLDQ